MPGKCKNTRDVGVEERDNGKIAVPGWVAEHACIMNMPAESDITSVFLLFVVSEYTARGSGHPCL